MSKQRVKEKKKKARQAKAKHKVLLRREHLRNLQKEERKRLLKEQAFDSLKKVNIPVMSEEKLEQRDEIIRQKIKENIELLKNLEAEHEKEKAARAALNERLEAEGHFDIKSKLEALQNETLDKTEEKN